MSPEPAPRPGVGAALLVVALGGALGAAARWALGVAVPSGGGFPWTTFGINVAGTAALAALPALAVVRRRPLLPLFCGTGVLGGFTTLSTWSADARALLAAGDTATALAYLVGTLAACLLAVAAVRRVVPPADRAVVADREGDL